MLGRYEPEFEVKLMLRTDLGFEEKTFIEEKMNLYVESYHMMLHDDGMTYSLKSPYEIGQGLNMGISFFWKLERYKAYFAVLKYYSYLEGDINGRRISSIVVPSRDYRKFMEDRQIELTDWERAVLIYNNPIASYDHKMSYLNKWMGQIKQIEKAFVDLPLLFRRKDIVHIMGTKLYGIVAGPADDEEEMQYRQLAKKAHYSESQVTVNVMYDGKRLLQMPYLEHVSPTQVEYAALNDYDERKAGLLRIVRQLYSD